MKRQEQYLRKNPELWNIDGMEIGEETEQINLHYTSSYLFSSDQQSYCFSILEKQSIAGTQQVFGVWVNEWMNDSKGTTPF